MAAMAKEKEGTEGADEEKQSFDGRLARLESLVQEMEAGGLGLETTIERYREGVGLLEGCRSILAGFKKQVEELTLGAEQALKPYDDDPDG
jgi:exodeoxyribonuclease VII small subunit